MRRNVDELKDENSDLKVGTVELRQQFSIELEKMRTVLQLAEERFQLNEKRILLDLDRERTTVVRLKKELDTSISGALRSAEKHKEEFLKLQREFGDCQQQNGHIAGTLKAVVTNFEQAKFEINRIGAELKESKAREVQAHKVSNQLRKKLENIQKASKHASSRTLR